MCGHTEGITDIPATGHSEVGDGNGKAATCTESGLTESKHCTVCGITTVAQTTISATGHSEVGDGNGKAATCTESGLTEGKQCTVCGTTTVAQNTISAKGHSYRREWSPSNHGRHTRHCSRGCGQYKAADCQTLTAVIGDVTLSICPICGRYGDSELEMQGEAAITDPATDKPGTFIARTALYPVANNTECIAAITAVYERNGSVVELAENAAPVTIKLPMPVDAPCRLVCVTIDELTQEQVLIPVEYTVENGDLIFSVNQLGLFLLIAE